MNTYDTPFEDPSLPFGNQLRNADGFRVPDQYFDQQLDWICHQVSLEDPSASGVEKGFQLPQGYFDQFSERLIDRIEKQNLSFLPANDGFKTPDDYFQKFESRLLEKLAVVQPKSKTIRFRQLVMLAIAACVMVAVSFAVMRLYQQEAAQDVFASCSDEELIEYLSHYAQDLDEESLAGLISEGDDQSLDFFEPEDEELESLLIDYLE